MKTCKNCMFSKKYTNTIGETEYRCTQHKFTIHDPDVIVKPGVKGEAYILISDAVYCDYHIRR